MMMKKLLLLTFAALTMVGCGGGGANADYLPFRATEKDNWGMVAPDGEILFASEFVNEPTVVIGGVFRVLNADDKYELFKIGQKPTQIGTTAYLRVGMFTENVAPAVLPNEPVILIDKNGKQIAKLDKLNGKIVEKVASFSDGYAIYTTSEDKVGMIDTKGAVHIDATYDMLTPYKGGIALGLINNDNRGDVYIFDKSGKATIIKDTKGLNLVSYSDGVAIFDNGDNLIGYNNKGEKVLKLDSKIKKIKPFVGQYAFFTDGDGWGMINKEGEIVIRAKYKSGNYLEKNFATFLNNDNKIVICDFDGTEITTDFPIVSAFLNGKNAFALENKRWIAINKEGKEVSPTTFHSIGSDGLNEYTEFSSDYIDFNDVIANTLGTITANGMAGYELGSTAQSIIEKTMPNLVVNKLNSGNNWKIENKDSRLSVETYDNAKMSAFLSLDFDKAPFSAITERAGSYYYSYNKTVGYKVNNASTLNRIVLSINIASRHASKSADLAKTIMEHIKATGLFNNPAPAQDDDEQIFTLKSDPKRQMSLYSYDDNVAIYFYSL